MKIIKSSLVITAFIFEVFLVGCTTTIELPASLASPSLNPTQAKSLEVSSTPTSFIVTQTPQPTSTPTLTEIIAPEVTHTPTLLPGVDYDLMQEKLSNIVLGVQSENIGECVRQGRDEIWYSVYPFIELVPLAAEPDKDYRFPRLSPDGNWISYIESENPYTSIDLKTSEIITGTDRVWIMRPDGSEKREIGQSMVNQVIISLMGNSLACDLVAYIPYPPLWSPDGKHISYVHQSYLEQQHTYYLVEVASGNTQSILTQTNGSQLQWLSNDRFIIKGDLEEFHEVQILSNGEFNIREIPFSIPEEVNSNNEYFFEYSSSMIDKVRAFFMMGGTYVSPRPTQVSIWDFDLINLKWNKLIDLFKETWRYPRMGKQWVSWCDETSKEIEILEPVTWNTILTHSILLDELDCDLLSTRDSFFHEWLVFSGKQEDIIGIWAIPAATQRVKPELLIDVSPLIGKGYGRYLAYFSFYPSAKDSNNP